MYIENVANALITMGTAPLLLHVYCGPMLKL